MTVERFNYCKSLSYDVLAVTELWRTQDKFQSNNKAFVVGEAKTCKETEEVRFPKDKLLVLEFFCHLLLSKKFFRLDRLGKGSTSSDSKARYAIYSLSLPIYHTEAG